MRSPAFLVLALLAAAPPLTLIWPTASSACQFCIESGPSGGSGPHFLWLLDDNVTACPAGDSVYAGHPSRLRIEVWYADANCLGKVGVPPESIWVTYSTIAGNLVVNDQGAKIYADDSTDACAHTRITVPSFSGCGTLQADLYISGIFKGSKTALVRSTDTDASGRTTSADGILPCDLNWDGLVTAADQSLVTAHEEHWRRNALHGTLVRRTNYCETCPPETPGTKGGSEVFWSPSGRYISHTQFVQVGQDVACKVFIVPSDPKEGNALTQFSFAPNAAHDYDPSWSPRNDFITWDRSDKFVIRKRVPWSGDPTEFLVTTSDNPDCGVARGDNQPAISPNGEWVVFSRCNGEPPGGWSLWKIRITGGTAIQLTPTVARTDFYPSWSPDGQTIYFQRQDENTFGDSRWTLWKVPAAGGAAQQVFIPPGSPLSDAVQPALSPDDKVLLMGHGVRDFLVRNVITHTLDPTLAAPSVQKVVPNYPDPNFAELGDFPLLSPRLSPDGTRTALGSKQIWAGRRNMNLPPAFVSVTSSSPDWGPVDDTTSTVDFLFFCSPGTVNYITVSATDPEGDPLTYLADFLIPGMSWNPVTRTLTYANGGLIRCPYDQTLYVRFRVTTPSGGTDALIAVITFRLSLMGSGGAGSSFAHEGREGAPEGPALPPGAFAVMAPGVPGATAWLTIFDLAGRRVATVRGNASQPLIWERRDDAGLPVSTGIYLYRLEAGPHRQEGKFLVIR